MFESKNKVAHVRYSKPTRGTTKELYVSKETYKTESTHTQDTATPAKRD